MHTRPIPSLRSSAVFNLKDHVGTLLAAIQDVTSTFSSILDDQHYNATHSRSFNPYYDVHIQGAFSRLQTALPSIFSIEADMRAVFQTINDRCNFISPINRLPDEILLYIFKLIPVQQDQYRVSGTLLASSVCGRWRALALGTGSLWATLEFPTRAHTHQIAELCLSRSLESGLDVYLGREREKRCGKNSLPDLLSHSTALRGAARWRNLTIEYHDCDNAVAVISQYVAAMEESGMEKTCLQSLTVTAPDSLSAGIVRNQVLEQGLHDLARAVPLGTLCLDGIFLPRATPQFRHLAHLTLKNTPPDTDSSISQLRCVLTACTGLRSLVLENVDLRRRDDDPRSPIFLPDLQTLSVTMSSKAVHAFITTCILAPNLQNLRIGTYNSDIADDVTAQFLKRHTSIRVLGFTSPPADLTLSASLSALPHVQTLMLGGVGNTMSFYGKDFLADIPPHAFPELHEVHIETGIALSDVEALKEFIISRSRTPGTSPIRTVSLICNWKYVAPFDVEVLKAWFDERTDVSSVHFEKLGNGGEGWKTALKRL
ncbi:hypothetical protein BOTBODRAFT_50809 [Botryobasidium botryosum FD-172 SS1]|uniref:F-box domain-containing protein n=1 Tax=Botryobasidium botryosum (strain FD-172 SS1) TaxID=930990 RepID=A0A067NAE0_BOTB1|nr:hypothetical protein BOTBODRAFT_50809 [Botryobasidium botryosum FD-172 SS1]